MSIDELRSEFSATRMQSLAIAAPLDIEDHGLQAAEFASPPKWHLAHTTWFFETFLLKPFAADYQALEPLYEVLFNSYYNGIGTQHPRGRRGLLSRPTLSQVLAYRERVDAAMGALLENPEASQRPEILERTRLGIEHERQHQELFFTDIKYSLAANPLYPAYNPELRPVASALVPLSWSSFEGGLVDIGYEGEDFCFDNELPAHRVYLQPFELADRLVSNAEYQAFIDDGGYQRPELWLADGWNVVQIQRWEAPLHWLDRDGQALEYTLGGLLPREASFPVCHVSAYEADAYARWAGARLPREAEWEHAADGQRGAADSGMDSAMRHPGTASAGRLQQLYGACWQWTQSAYSPYPGFVPGEGAIGEYNGKFMSNQLVLRGGSCVTKSSQARPTYRNFFYPQDRWQFSGIRLAR